MNKICETCDSRNRLKLCDGKDGDFKYCSRPSGSLQGITNEMLFQFNTLDEFLEQHIKIRGYEPYNLTLEDYDMGKYGKQKIIMGDYVTNYKDGTQNISRFPVAFVMC